MSEPGQIGMSRLSALHADPSSAEPGEISAMAEMAHAYRRMMLTKTLRDEFAMAALTGLLARGIASASAVPVAYVAADAMMKARLDTRP